MKKKPLSHGVGRRKSSVARVWLRNGKGKIEVNEKDYSKYFDTTNARLRVELPFKATGLGDKFDISVNISGGGKMSQADAVKLGISRALLANNENLRKTLRKYDLLTVDSRVKERKKYGQKGARAKFQFVKR
ncbi:30S ribosomal protein S9 [Candidatus Babeliales bacterium]|nr:30S ribosomal protein S9 [Candidatus Babeliales bacterium]